MRPKNPRAPRQELSARVRDFVSYEDVLYRIHRTQGRHRTEWDQMRTWGPLTWARWDPHPEPPGEHGPSAVMYTATDHTTAFGEAFQQIRAISISSARTLAAWTPRRTLVLLDLTDTWAVRNGAAGSLDSAPRSTCRSWARAIRASWPDLDGLWTQSTITKRPVVSLFAPARDSFPRAPGVSRALDHRALGPIVEQAADELDWPLRRGAR